MNQASAERSRPTVLVFAGADPSGGAGIAADILAIAAQGAHALPVITALTVQDNNRVYEVLPVDCEVVRRQVLALMGKVAIHAVKIGIPGSRSNAVAIAGLIGQLRMRQPDCRWCWTRCLPAAPAMPWRATIRAACWRHCCRWPR